ncbi:transcriptional regulator with XRE-family HTH domain [Streptomyces aurantiacus]|uniref:helix-turn-helix domain-containing protein n=1 Tax=Streptomyces aurantiacus TaxID=47760 RepID=UPI00278E7F93|nr:helix-turn-helix transcriptional regulator [Streptomyces aurantiacus]MDQ0774334.1 transcriptional regulator with XRE-family HTH domain [Streptomyces aurantiacus]
MAPRHAPTARHRRLATEVRRLREQAGISVQQAASLLNADRTLVSNIEAARTGLSEERVRQLASIYRCPEPALIDALASLIGPRRPTHWWDEYRGKIPEGHLEVSEVEHFATRIRTAQTVHLPGLLQTEDYARAIFELTIPKLSRLEVELRIAHRLGRQKILTRSSPTPYVGIIHEVALRLNFGGRGAARTQLEHLAEASERDNITLLVIPFSAGGFHGAGQSVLYAEGAVPQLDTVQLDTELGSHFVDAPTPLTNYRSLLELMEQAALPAGDSQTLIRSIAREQ